MSSVYLFLCSLISMLYLFYSLFDFCFLLAVAPLLFLLTVVLMESLSNHLVLCLGTFYALLYIIDSLFFRYLDSIDSERDIITGRTVYRD